MTFVISRFRREEMKIQAWENHQKAKSEAEMKKTEVKYTNIATTQIQVMIESNLEKPE